MKYHLNWFASTEKLSMRIFFTGIILIYFKTAVGCGIYISNRDIRLRFFRPELFCKTSDIGFISNDNIFNPEYINYEDFPINSSTKFVNKNLVFWKKIGGAAVSMKDIEDVLNKSNNYILKNPNENTFVSFLHRKENHDLLEYFKFAYKLQIYNSILDWQNTETNNLDAEILVKIAFNRIHSLKYDWLKRRYLLLILRLNYYHRVNIDPEQLLHQMLKLSSGEKDFVYHWALHYVSLTFTNEAQLNWANAQVFESLPDKRMRVFTLYNKKIPLDSTLKFASNPRERANIFALASLNKKGKVLPWIKKFWALEKNYELLDILLLRETEKLQDWLLTPYYVGTTPTYYNNPLDKNTQKEIDQKYAIELIKFIRSLPKKTQNIRLIECFLLFFTQQNAICTTSTRALLEDSKLSRAAKKSLANLLVLCSIRTNASADNSHPKLSIVNAFKQKNTLLVFMAAREYELADNLPYAMALLSSLEIDTRYLNHFIRPTTGVVNMIFDLYDNYFLYLDAQYQERDILKLIDYITSKDHDSFEKIFIKNLRKDLPRLYDLVGTKYFRKRQLKKAQYYFEKVPDSLWISKAYSYKDCMKRNPFTFYHSDSLPVNWQLKPPYSKTKINKLLIALLQKAQNPKDPDRAFSYYLLGNAFYNFGHRGNTWMMQVYYWSSHDYLPYVNCQDFFENKTAAHYYALAAKYAKTETFKALCDYAAHTRGPRPLKEEQTNRFNYSWELPTPDPLLSTSQKKSATDDSDLNSNCELPEQYSLNEYYLKTSR